jgi:hypothetical protein
MTATSIQIETTEYQTVYSFKVLSTANNLPLDSYFACVEPNFNNQFEVSFFTDGSNPKYKIFADENDANLYAMKVIYQAKKKYN